MQEGLEVLRGRRLLPVEEQVVARLDPVGRRLGAGTAGEGRGGEREHHRSEPSCRHASGPVGSKREAGRKATGIIRVQ